MTVIWYEVLPVTLLSGQAVLISQHQPPALSPWMIQNQANVHPNDIVITHLVHFFGDIFCPQQTIVHSTSWRYDDSTDRLLLTYLAVLPQGKWLKQWISSSRISVEPVSSIQVQYGDHLSPPEHIHLPGVIAHALDHLASLHTYDPAIQAVLEPEWGTLLGMRAPKPAGYLLQPAPV